MIYGICYALTQFFLFIFVIRLPTSACYAYVENKIGAENPLCQERPVLGGMRGSGFIPGL